MAEKFSEFPINFVLAGLFVICMFFFATGIYNEHGQSTAILNDTGIDFESLEEGVEEMNKAADGWKESFAEDNVFFATGTLILSSVFGIAKLMWISLLLLFDIMFTGVANVLGIPPIVTGTILTIIIISLIFLIWRVVKQGE